MRTGGVLFCCRIMFVVKIGPATVSLMTISYLFFEAYVVKIVSGGALK